MLEESETKADFCKKDRTELNRKTDTCTGTDIHIHTYVDIHTDSLAGSQ